MEGATRNTCHMTGAAAGLLVILSLGLFGSTGWPAALVLGVIAGAVLSAVLVWLICEGVTAMDGSHWVIGTQAVAPEAGAVGGAVGGAAEVVAPVVSQPRVAVPVADAGMAPSGDAQVAHDRTVSLAEPEGNIYGRRAAPADALTQITGIGPKIAAALNEAGVTRFAQIADWDDAAIRTMATQVGRGAGRIRRDDWVGQARALAAGEDYGAS